MTPDDHARLIRNLEIGLRQMQRERESFTEEVTERSRRYARLYVAQMTNVLEALPQLLEENARLMKQLEQEHVLVARENEMADLVTASGAGGVPPMTSLVRKKKRTPVCGARRRWYSCRCTRVSGHAGLHRCGRSGLGCRVIAGPKLNKGPYPISGEWR